MSNRVLTEWEKNLFTLEASKQFRDRKDFERSAAMRAMEESTWRDGRAKERSHYRGRRLTSFKVFGKEHSPFRIKGRVFEAVGKIKVELDGFPPREELICFRVAGAVQVKADGLMVGIGVIELAQEGH